MTQKKGIFQYIAIALRWIRPRITPAIVFVALLPFSVMTRVFFGAPVWLIAFGVALTKRFIQVQQRRQRQPVAQLD